MINKEQFHIIYAGIYFLLFYVCILHAIAHDLDDIKIRQKNFDLSLAAILVLLITLTVGLRDISVGTDTNNYYRFYWLALENTSDSKDFLMRLWMKLIKYFTHNYQYFLLLNSLLLSILFFLSALKISKYYRVSVLFIIFSYYSMFFMRSIEINIVRQGLSLVSLLLSYQYYITGRRKKSIALGLSAIFRNN